MRPRVISGDFLRTLWKKQLGSWGQAVKKVGTSSTDAAWDEDDTSSTIDALWDTGENVCIYAIDTARDYEDFLALLNDEKADRLSIYASMGSWTTNYANNIWMGPIDYPDDYSDDPAKPDYESQPLKWDPAEPPTKPDGLGAAWDEQWMLDKAFKDTWVEAWVLAARFLSGVALLHSNLKGFVIDDFDGLVESADVPFCLYGKALTRDDVKSIYDAAHSQAKGFKFVPTGYYTTLGRVIGDGYILGANYGLTLHDGETMGVTLTFDLPRAPLVGVLSLFHTIKVDPDLDDNATVGSNVRRYIRVNSHEIYEADVGKAATGWETRIEYLEKSIGRSLRAGENTIEIELKPIARTNITGTQLFWYVWGVSLQVASLPVVDPGVRPFARTATLAQALVDLARRGLHRKRSAPIGFGPGGRPILDVAVSDIPLLVTRETVTFKKETFWANPSKEEYTPANSGVDFTTLDSITNDEERGGCSSLPYDENSGFMARRLVAAPNKGYLIHDLIDGFMATATKTVPASEDDALDPSGHYDALLSNLKTILEPVVLMALHWAYHAEDDVDPAILKRRLEIASECADATIVWNMPIGIRFVDAADRRGVFAECAAIDGSATMMAFWPGRQSDLPGWFQRWTSNSGLTKGDSLLIQMKDLHDTADAMGILFKSVYDASTPAIYGPTDVSSDSKNELLPTDPISVTLGDSPLVLALSLGSGAGDWPERVHMFVQYSDGSPVPSSAFDFESGIEAGALPDVIATYDVIVDVFRSVRWSEMLPLVLSH
jgi:hypothetical protein